MTSTQITKNQHYVPRMYLRAFDASEKTLWTFDKTMPPDSKSNCNRRAIKSLASAPFFYDLPATRDESDPEMLQVIERKLGNIEGIAARFLNATIKGLSPLTNTNFDPESYARPLQRWFANMAWYATIQYIRTDSGRDLMRRCMDDIARKELEEAVAAIAPDADPTNFEHRLNENVKWHHINAIFDCADIVPFFYKRIWRIGVNSGPVPFWTSDTPVVLLHAFDDSRAVALAGC